jgi:hypothetical protein
MEGKYISFDFDPFLINFVMSFNKGRSTSRGDVSIGLQAIYHQVYVHFAAEIDY